MDQKLRYKKDNYKTLRRKTEKRGFFLRQKIIKKEKKKIGQILYNIGFGNNFLDMTLKVQAIEKNEHI